MMLLGTMRSDDFERNSALQHCYDVRKKKLFLSPVSSRFIFVFAPSLFLGARNKLSFSFSVPQGGDSKFSNGLPLFCGIATILYTIRKENFFIV